MKHRLTIIFFTTILAALSVVAQPISFIRTFTVNDGLPSNSITAIKQDCHDLIWIATWNGLCCYDGYHFTSFQGEEWGTANALTTRRISAIGPDSKGNIWVRTYDAGLYLFDTHQCQYINIGALLYQKYGKHIQPRHIYNLSSGITWISDESGTMNLRIDDQNPNDVDRMKIINLEDNLHHGRSLIKVETDSKGHEWIITDKGMMRYDTKEFRKGVFSVSDGARNAEARGKSDAEVYVQAHGIIKYFIDHQGNLWNYSSQGLSLVNFRYHPIRMLPLEPDQQTRSVVCRKDGSVWAGTRNGILAVYSHDGQLVSRKNFAQNMYAMHEDRQGNLWIGTRGDGLYLIGADGRMTGHFTHSDIPYSISHDEIYDIEEDEDGNIWIATWGGGVNLVKNEERTVKGGTLRFIHKGNEMKGYPKEGFDKVRRIIYDGRGTMIASTTWGLLTFASQNDGFRKFHTTRQVANDTTSLRANDVMQVLVCRNGSIYIATMGGGIQEIISDNLQQDSLRLQTVKSMNEGRGNVLSMVEDKQGNIWIVRESQVNRYNTKKGLLEQFGPNSMSEPTELTEALPDIDSEGNIWIGAVGGVMTFNVKQISKSSYKPNILFTSIRYQGEQQEQPVLNQQTLYITDKDMRSMTIGFAALDYGNNYLLQYAYKMKETDADWNYIGHDPHIAFSHLSAGRHTLIVRSTNCDGVWMDNDTEIVIEIEPMLWERTWVQLIALLLVIGLSTWAVIVWLSHRRKMRERELRMERILKQYGDLNEDENGTPNQRHKYELAEPQIVNEDEEMMNRLMEYIEKRIGDETLKIEEMADAVGLSRTVFYERIRELVGVSPSDFLRQVRMQRACQLVAKSKMPFSQIAYAVGFTNPKYFTKSFKKQTGMTPSEYRKKEV